MLRTTLSALSAVLAAACLVACGSSDNGSTDNTPAGTTATAFPTSNDPAQPVPTEDLKPINIILAGADLFVGENNFAFGLTNENDIPQGKAKATVTFYDLSEQGNPKPVGTFEAVESAAGVGEIVEHEHANGEVHLHGGQDENRVVYYVPVTFPHDGAWGVVIQAELQDGTVGQSDVGFLVRPEPLFPSPGEKAIASDNLTAADVDDISEIDSGTPPNDMHDVKIKDSIAAGRPVVVVFSTPAYCTSRFCGPVNEEVESLHEEYKDKVDFVHIEIWRDFEAKTLNPTTREWLLQKDDGLTEPWVFIVDSEGVIYDRWEGAPSRIVMEDAVKAVAAGETFATKEKPPTLE